MRGSFYGGLKATVPGQFESQDGRDRVLCLHKRTRENECTKKQVHCDSETPRTRLCLSENKVLASLSPLPFLGRASLIVLMLSI